MIYMHIIIKHLECKNNIKMQNGTYNFPKNILLKKFLYIIYKSSLHGLIIYTSYLISSLIHSHFFFLRNIILRGAHMIDHIPIPINCSIIN